MSASETSSRDAPLALPPQRKAPVRRGSPQGRPAPQPLDVPLVSVGGMALAAIDRRQSAELMVRLALAGRGSGRPPAIITSANGQVISMCAQDERMRKLFAAADLIHADGMPLVFASRLKCRTAALPERVATTDLFHDVARLAEAEGASFYFLGATEEIIQRTVRNVRAAYPKLKIAGFRNGYFDRHQEGRVLADINAARPDILWVGMGVPNEQLFCVRNRERLRNVGVVKTSGGLFDFLSGKNRRAPAWMQSVGLEWLYRVRLEPRRLLRRYLMTNPHAALLLLTKPSRVIREGAVTREPGRA